MVVGGAGRISKAVDLSLQRGEKWMEKIKILLLLKPKDFGEGKTHASRTLILGSSNHRGENHMTFPIGT